MTSQSLKNLAVKIDEIENESSALVNEGDDSILLSELSANDARAVVALANQASITWSAEHAADGQVQPDDDFDIALEPFRITLEKPISAGTLVLFTMSGLRTKLDHDDNSGDWIHLQSVTAFSTLARQYLTWGKTQAKPADNIKRPSPRELVRESGAPTAPARIEPWLLDIPLSHLPIGDPVFDEWAKKSLMVARRCLANEILVDSTIVFSGPPKVKIDGKAELPYSKDILFQCQRALRWVYESDHQSEIRHGLMSAEISRHSAEGGITDTSIAAAVEGAKIAYQLSLSGISKDSLKAIADVRKAVTDEINKTADTTRQLATAVAGAVFLGLGVVAARVTSSAPPMILIALSLVLATYVAAAIYTSVHFMALQESLRADWKQRFYSFLDKEEYKVLVTNPLEKSKCGFNVVSWVAGIISALMVIAVILLVVLLPETSSAIPALIPK